MAKGWCQAGSEKGTADEEGKEIKKGGGRKGSVFKSRGLKNRRRVEESQLTEG